MSRLQPLIWLYLALGYGIAILGVLSAAIAATLRSDPAQVEKYLGVGISNLVVTAQNLAWMAIPLSVLAIAAMTALQRRIGEPKTWGLVQTVLDQFRARVFSSDSDDLHEHRVTLFRHVGWCWCLRRWPWSGWLVPVARSGHTTQRTDALFMAPDDAERAEGVAGKTWALRRTVFIDRLPNLRCDGVTPEAKAEYAKLSLMPDVLVEKRNPKARSLYGAPVEVKGQIWGVVVVDSRKETFSERKVERYNRLLAGFLAKALEGL
jgi:hypothetical protein